MTYAVRTRRTTKCYKLSLNLSSQEPDSFVRLFAQYCRERYAIRGLVYFKTENNCNITGFMRWQKVMNQADERLSKSWGGKAKGWRMKVQQEFAFSCRRGWTKKRKKERFRIRWQRKKVVYQSNYIWLEVWLVHYTLGIAAPRLRTLASCSVNYVLRSAVIEHKH